MPSASATLAATPAADGTLRLVLTGRLDATSTGRLWREAEAALAGRAIAKLTVDAAGVAWCDGSGVALLVHLRERQRAAGGGFELTGLAPEIARLLNDFPPGALDAKPRPLETPGFVEQVGRGAAGIWKDLVAQVAFTGELAATLAAAALHPKQVRWKDAWRVAERAGVNAFPIIALVGFLIGLILAFQAAIPMKQFGAEIFVADLVALSVIRELGPLMTAIVLAGRSGSAFAAEIGTMRVNEEINALTTMGLTPVRFLVVPRVLAAVAVTPLLTAFTNFFGLVGGLVVMWSLGFPTVTYVNEVRGALRGFDLPGGLIKSLAFGLLVAGIGCLRGLQTGTGASAVGESTTRAVVAGIVLIILSDGLFSVVYYYLGI